MLTSVDQPDLGLDLGLEDFGLEKTVCFMTAPSLTPQAASFALGSIAAGNLPHFLPHLLKGINESSHEYQMRAIPTDTSVPFL